MERGADRLVACAPVGPGGCVVRIAGRTVEDVDQTSSPIVLMFIDGTALVACAPVGPGGCVVRIAGRTVEDVDHTLRDLLGFVPRLLGDSPWARKW